MADFMVEAGDLPLWCCAGIFLGRRALRFRRIQTAFDTETRAAPLNNYRGRPSEAEEAPFTTSRAVWAMSPSAHGAALRPKWPPSDGCARAIPLLRNPWRVAADLRPADPDTWVAKFIHFPESESRPKARKIYVGRARAANRARIAVWDDPTQAGVVDPGDLEEGAHMIYARQDEDAGDIRPEMADFRDYGGIHDWSSVSHEIFGAGVPWAREASAFPPKRADQTKSTGRCDDVVASAKNRAGGSQPGRRKS